MGYKNKSDWINYSRRGEIIEILIRDQSGAKVGTFKANNQKDYSKVLRIIKDKYGYKPESEIKDSPNFDKEKNWLKSNSEW